MTCYRFLPMLILFTSAGLLSACIPTVTEKWLVQPVEGQVFIADSFHPLAGARVINADDPDISAVTDEQGKFTILGVSETRFHMVLPASYLDRQVWVVDHPDYAPAVGLTRTLAPALEEQPQGVSIPVFSDLESGSSVDCPHGEYLIRLGEWLDNAGEINRDSSGVYFDLIDHFPCSDAAIRTKLDAMASALVR